MNNNNYICVFWPVKHVLFKRICSISVIFYLVNVCELNWLQVGY